VTSASQQMREALFFYPWLDSVSVQNGSPVWSKLLIPYHGVGGSIARPVTSGRKPTAYCPGVVLCKIAQAIGRL